MRVRELALFAGLLALGTACSKECTGALSEVGAHCPATFDGTEAQLPPCGSQLAGARMCADLIELAGAGLAGLRCFYDPSTHELVGASWWSDIKEFCDNDSFTKSAGRTPNATCTTPYSVRRQCPP